MKVLRINTSSSQGGAALSAINIQGAVTELDVDSRMLSGSNEECLDGKILSLGVSRQRFYLNVLLYRLFGIEGAANSLLWKPILDDLDRYDLIHLHNIHGYYMPMDVLRLLLNRPCVWTLHDFWLVTGGIGFPLSGHENRSVSELLLPFANFRYPAEWIDRSKRRREKLFELIRECRPSFVAVSHAMADRLINMGLDSDDLTIISHGFYEDAVAPEYDDRKLIREQMGWPMGKKVLLFVSAQVDNPVKGCSVFLEALKELPDQNSWVAYIAGNKYEISRRNSSALGSNVKFLGKIPGSEIQKYFRACDIYVTPTYDETFGRTVVEALAEGAGVVCSDLPVLREVSMGCADFFPPGGVEALRISLLRSMKMVNSKERLDVAKKIRKKFSKNQMAEKYVELYENVTGRKRWE